MTPSSNLALVGPMGAGKSSVGRWLADRLGLAFVDADRALEQAAGASIPELFAREGEAGFRLREAATLRTLLAGDNQLVACGGGAVLDPANRALLRERAYVVHLHASVEQQLARLAGDTSRPLLAGDDRAATLARLAAARTPLYHEVADLVLDGDGLAVGEAGARLIALLQGRWVRPQVPA